jgi:uncharacterized protein YqeY
MYLPQQMSEPELLAAVDAAIAKRRRRSAGHRQVMALLKPGLRAART